MFANGGKVSPSRRVRITAQAGQAAAPRNQVLEASCDVFAFGREVPPPRRLRTAALPKRWELTPSNQRSDLNPSLLPPSQPKDLHRARSLLIPRGPWLEPGRQNVLSTLRGRLRAQQRANGRSPHPAPRGRRLSRVQTWCEGRFPPTAQLPRTPPLAVPAPGRLPEKRLR